MKMTTSMLEGTLKLMNEIGLDDDDVYFASYLADEELK